MPELKIEGVGKQYKDLIALENFSYVFENGIYGILGPNGAGKSTLMKIITGIIERDSGELFYDKKDISKIKKEYKTHIGYMPQQQDIYSNMSLIMFLYYIAALKGVKKPVAKEQIDRLLIELNLTDKRTTKLGELSGGMRQRALIAQALLGNPDILVLDEPTAGLDPKERINIRNLIYKYSAEKIVIISTHIVEDIEFISQEVLFMDKGKIIRAGKPSELCDEIDGSIYEIVVEKKAVWQYSEKYRCSSIMADGEVARVRFVSKTSEKDFEKVKPNLADLYMYLFERGDNV